MEIRNITRAGGCHLTKINPFGVLISSLGKEIRISDRSVIRQARAIYDSMSVTEQKNLTCRAVL